MHRITLEKHLVMKTKTREASKILELFLA